MGRLKKHGANWRETCCSGHLILQWWKYHCLSGRQGEARGSRRTTTRKAAVATFPYWGEFLRLEYQRSRRRHCFCTAGCCVGKDRTSPHRQHIGEEIVLATLVILSININMPRLLSVEPIINLRVKWKKCSHTHWCQLQIVCWGERIDPFVLGHNRMQTPRTTCPEVEITRTQECCFVWLVPVCILSCADTNQHRLPLIRIRGCSPCLHHTQTKHWRRMEAWATSMMLIKLHLTLWVCVSALQWLISFPSAGMLGTCCALLDF